MTKTLLWTNPNPTSNMSYGDITLSDNFDNYDYLMIEYKGITTGSEVFTSLYKTSQLHSAYCQNALGAFNSAYCVRAFWHSDGVHADNVIYMNDCYKYQSSSGTINSACIPINIYGVNGKIN